MTTAVIGATGRVGGEVVRGVLARGDEVTALVRDGDPAGLCIRPARLDVARITGSASIAVWLSQRLPGKSGARGSSREPPRPLG